MAKYKIEMMTRQGDTLAREVSEEEALRLEREPWREDSNIAWTNVTRANTGEGDR